jgi:hypothetical protein
MKRDCVLLYPPRAEADEQQYLPIHEAIYQTLCGALSRETSDKVAQSHVMIGAEGSGKTTLLGHLAAAVAKMPGLYPVIIPGQALFSVDDIRKYCARDSDDATRRVVLLIDNIQYLFKRIDNAAQYALRGWLNTPGAPILVATCDEVLPEFTDYKSAFFDGLKLSYLRPIDEAEMALLRFSAKETVRAEALLEYLPRTIRSLMLVRRVFRISSHQADDLNVLCDLLAPSYRAKYDSYVFQSQHILMSLASTASGMTLSDLRLATGQESGMLSPYLRKLVDQKVIRKVSTSTRNAVYQVEDPLFSFYLRQINFQ